MVRGACACFVHRNGMPGEVVAVVRFVGVLLDDVEDE
jgi:hypothetical protein